MGGFLGESEGSGEPDTGRGKGRIGANTGKGDGARNWEDNEIHSEMEILVSRTAEIYECWES
jgi:hypothetical protein